MGLPVKKSAIASQLTDTKMFAQLATGAMLTLVIVSVTIVASSIMAVIFGYLLRSTYSIMRIPTRIFVEIFRGSSLLVQIYFFYFVLPEFGIFFPGLAVAIVTLSLNCAAYGAVTVAAVLAAIPQGQLEAAKALSFDSYARERFIIFPQTFVRLIPPWGNFMVGILKASSVVSLIAVQDLTFKAYQINSMTHDTISIFGLTLVIYFMIGQIFTFVARVVERSCTAHGARG